eukprot:TRINITY_DN28437_c0_g1_i1.p1 TRINITY_DN28437_c0_g1~~TRINITY_DN28437_c0_g1_i1.p1  ORF type:complete len:1749 (+),score=272.47 TRINITY_DN28437_c0_g1_i1:294-5249(+)
MTLPQAQREEICTVIGVIVDSSQEALGRVALHQDACLRELLGATEKRWANAATSSAAAASAAPAEPSAAQDAALAKSCPSIAALVWVLRKLRGEPQAEWLRLHVEAMLPRLRLAARQLLTDEVDATSNSADGGRAAKRPRQVAGDGSIGRALRPLELPRPGLAWGPPPAPDLGALASCLDAVSSSTNDLANSELARNRRGEGQDAPALSRLLCLLSQPSIVAQMRRESALARLVIQSLTRISPAAIAQLAETTETDLLEGALPALCQGVPNKLIDEILCSGALLGATALQVHASIRVRHVALSALCQLSRHQQVAAGARKLLERIVDPQHLCLEDLRDIVAADSDAAPVRGPSPDNNGIVEAWAFVNETCAGQPYSIWVRTLCSKMLGLGHAAWDEPAASMLRACAPLAQCVEWFAERMLVLAILKAATHKHSGRQLAEAVSTFFKQDVVETAQAQCIIRGLQYVRIYQTGQKQRAVPHFPTDRGDPFWGVIDLCAVAESASKVGCAREGLLYLELHLSHVFPDKPIDQTILRHRENAGGGVVGVDELFRAPSREAGLLHTLAKQLPDDDLLYGVSEWCHASSRLVRAELGHDHLLQLRLHSDLREAELYAADAAVRAGRPTAFDGHVQAGLEEALARLGLYTVFAGSRAIGEGRASVGSDNFASAGSVESSDTSAAWERRMEGLWRLRQWGDDASRPWSNAAPAGFHAELHGSLAALASVTADGPARRLAGDGPSKVAGLAGLVADVASGLSTRSLEHRRAGVVRLQMLGSLFTMVEAAARDSSSTSAIGSAESGAVSGVASRWSAAASVALPAPHFLLVEPLAALQGTLLALAAPPVVELRFLTALASQMRGAAQVHRALGLLEQAQRVSQGAPRPDLLRLRWEQARCFWELKQQQESLSIARAVSAECRRSPPRSSDKIWMARALSDTGLWLANSRMEGPSAISEGFLEPAVSMSPADPQPRRRLAEFLDARLSEEIAHQGSIERAHSRNLHKKTQAELEGQQRDLQAMLRNPHRNEAQVKALQEYVRSRERTCEQDRQQEKAERERLKTFVLSAVQGLGRCLIDSKVTTGDSEGQSLTRIACRFLSLWFDYCKEYPEVTAIVRDAMPTLALGALSPFLYQLASRLGTHDQEFQQTLEELLLRIAARSPQNIWPLLLLKNGDQVPKGMRSADKFTADQTKIDASKRVLERLRKEATVRKVLEATEVLSRFYMNIAFFEVDKKNRDVKIRVSSIEGFNQLRKVLQHVPVPTTLPSPDGGPQAAGIASFQETIGVAKQGLSAPKMLSVTDTSGRVHPQIVKGMDDLRQDAVMQQLFRLLNDVFGENARSRQAELQLRTFQVVPLSPCAGIMECVSGVTLGEMLTGNTNPTEGAHQRYRPNDWQHQSCRKRMQDAREAYNVGEHDALLKAYQECIDHFRPVMHMVHLEKFPQPADWHLARRRYTRSAAVSSMVGYIVGIGDRHPNNILFDDRTGELVHIDFGITFEQGRALRVPELVPCRLTRDIVDGLGCLGTCGPFRRDCETALGVLREGSALVNAVVEVFVHDPVYLWSLSPWKAMRRDAAGSSDPQPSAAAQGFELPQALLGGGGAGAEKGNEMAKRALLTVKGKLHGEHGGTAASLGVPAHVAWIIREAMDPANLSGMFCGWSQWL